MTQTELLRILETIPIGQRIPGMNTGTQYRFAGIGEYQSRGKAADFDGAPMVTLESSRRRPPNIRLLVGVLATFMADGKAGLGFGRTPRSVILAYRRGYGPRPPNLYEYESHYKSLARYVYGLVT